MSFQRPPNVKPNPTSNAKGTKKKSSALSPSSATVSPANSRPMTPQGLQDFFGPGGKVYVKKGEDELEGGWGGGVKKSTTPVPVTTTPHQTHIQHQHQAGGLKITNNTISQPKPSKPTYSAQSGAMLSQRLEPAKPKARPSSPISSSSKNKTSVGTGTTKSKEVKAIEKTIRQLKSIGKYDDDNAEDEEEKEVRKGCFCQARNHPLSSHTPTCPSCCLSLCILNLPSNPCPSCSSPTLSPSNVLNLISNLESQLLLQLEREETERRRIEREKAFELKEKFPELQHHSSTHLITQEPVGRKVLSLNSKTNKVKMSTFVPKPPTPIESTSFIPAKVKNTDPTIVLKPRMVPLTDSERQLAVKQWTDVQGGRRFFDKDNEVVYIPLPEKEDEAIVGEEKSGGKKKRSRARGKKKDGAANGDGGAEDGGSVAGSSVIGN